jgi:hypothetical protein
MDTAQSRCFRHVRSMIMSQRSCIKTLQQNRKKQSSRKKQVGKATSSRMQSYANVVRAQDLLDPFHQVFPGVAIRAKKDVQQSMLQLPDWSEPVNSQTDVGLMVGSSPQVRRERDRMVRIGTGQERTLVARRCRCTKMDERGELVMQSLFLKQLDFVVQCRNIRLQRHDTNRI